MDQDINIELIRMALKYMENSYSPYSNFRVGAAVLGEDGKIYGGCNIENAAYSPTNCAERTAIFKSISEGNRSIKKIAIVSDKPYTYPCGVCRQVIKEFGDKVEIIIGNRDYDYRVMTLDELLPNSFGRKDIEED